MDLIYAVLIYMCASLGVVESGLPFVQSTENPGDPRQVALLREALMHAGISADGIILKAINTKHPETKSKEICPSPMFQATMDLSWQNSAYNKHCVVPMGLKNWEIYKTAYRALYINKLGQTCFLKWHVNVIGMQSPKMPVCENTATGTGSNPLRVKAYGPPAYYNPYGVPPYGPSPFYGQSFYG